MNKNLFKVDDSEKMRILEMHQLSTNRHYLGEQVDPEASSEPVSTDNEYVNNPDIVNIQSEITKLNGIVSKFKSPFNLKSYGLIGVNRGNISMLQLVKYKIDSSGRSSIASVVFEIHLGQTEKSFSSGSQFSNENVNRINTTDAQTLMTKIVNDITMFSAKFSLGDKITLWAANSITIERNPKK